MPIRFEISEYINPVFVETGSYRGDGIAAALSAGFEKVYSIEVHEPYYNGCCERFAAEIEEGRVELRLGPSEERLRDVVAGLEERATFWLDAHRHFEGASEVHCPVSHELDAIGTSQIRDHVILIDDIRLVRDPAAWGGHDVSLGASCAQLFEINPDYHLSLIDGEVPRDVLVALPRNYWDSGNRS